MLFLSEKLNDPRIPGKILFNEDENAHLPPHWHSNVEICFFLQGGFCARIDGQCYTVQNQQRPAPPCGRKLRWGTPGHLAGSGHGFLA